MLLPLLISGGNPNLRKTTAFQNAKETSSDFDIIVLDAGDEHGIGDIRNLNLKFHRRPFESQYQSFIILEAQNLTIEAQNALLKILEEPPKSSRVIMTTQNNEGLLSTVSSRCGKLELALDTKENTDHKAVETLLNLSFFDYYKKASSLNFETWVDYWRSKMLFMVYNQEIQTNTNDNLIKLVRYLKFLFKIRKLQKRKVSSKLINLVALLEAPKIY